MPVIHKLDGLIAWTRRAEWREDMAETLIRHVAQACAGADLEAEDLWNLLDNADQGVIWGAAFEDLLSSDLPDGRNLADDYLKRRGWKEPVATREYIAALRHSVISLYEVSEVVPGESMLLRDLVCPSEPVRVLEKSGTRSLRQWDRVATRVIPQRGGTVISGTLLPFDQETSEQLLGSLRRVRSKAGGLVAEVAKEIGRTVSAERAGAALTPELLLGRSAFAFTNLWLAAALRAELDDTPPEVANSDGDPLQFVTLHFPLRPGVTLAAVRAALDGIPALERADANFWNWLASPAKPPKRVAQKPTGVQLSTTMEGGSVVLGNVEISGRKVILSVNSEARSERGRALLEPVLQGLVRPPLVERQDLEQMLAEKRASKEEPPPLDLPPQEVRAILQQQLEEHYRQVLDQPIPALGNVSPRRAARTAKGREKVVNWLKTLENHSSKRPAGDPIGEYDFAWMWQELGVTELRR
ncbi:MAG TPA: hypothetical protein VIL69_04875 [Roseomonas sp.]